MKKRQLMVLFGVLALGAAGCGGDADGNDDAAETDAAAEQMADDGMSGDGMSSDGATPDGAAQELPAGVTAAMVAEGKTVFEGAGICTSCHGPAGEGVPNLGANLADDEWVHSDGSYVWTLGH
jgi:cytochrome c5